MGPPLAFGPQAAKRAFLGAPRAAQALLVAGLLLVTVHSLLYAFQTDDAFISYRYARNAAAGYGLVFNPGGERVEGYTNFLWVLLLAAGRWIGLHPPEFAVVLSFVLTLAVWYLVTALLLSLNRPSWPWWVMGWGPLALSLTRSFAVWSTGGLETRLFEFLLLLGTLLAASAVLADQPGGRAAPLPGYLLGLAELARPEGLMLGAVVLGLSFPPMVTRPAHRRLWNLWTVSFVSVVISHFAFRLLYYHQLLPNTYYAKAAGRWWWGIGSRYLATFAIEYSAYLWIVPLLVGIGYLRRRGAAALATLLAATAVMQCLFVASVGGDHFEYRLIDIVPVCLIPLVHLGCGAMTERRGGRMLSALTCAIMILGLTVIPIATHLASPRDYVAGFPAESPKRSGVAALQASWPGRLWPASVILDTYQKNLIELTRHFVDIRQEEHKLFFERAEAQGRLLQRLVRDGSIPADTYAALDCVGAIPYLSDLRVLDRLGLTDSTVAHGKRGPWGTLAHDKRASFEYARARGVELWALHPVNLAWDVSEAYPVDELVGGNRFYFALTDETTALVCLLPQGLARTQPRFPRLTFRSTGAPAAVREYMVHAIAALRQRAESHPADLALRVRLAYWLLLTGRDSEAAEIAAATREAGRSSPEWWRVEALIALAGRDTALAAAGFSRAAALAREEGHDDLADHLARESSSLRAKVAN